MPDLEVEGEARNPRLGKVDVIFSRVLVGEPHRLELARAR
jgi:hypothetical protein